jgi:hypothetical protein
MSTLGVILALAAVSLQGNAAVEGPLEPEPLWGDDIHVWDMGADSSTYVSPGMQYCDMAALNDTLYAIAIKSKDALDAFNIYWSLNSYEWFRRRIITNYRKTYSPNMRITHDGNILYVSSSVRTSDSTYFLVFRYDMPDFSNFNSTTLQLPEGSDSVNTAEIVENIASGNFWLFGSDIGGDVYLSVSEDSCCTWSSWDLVLPQATMQSADGDVAGNIFVAYRDPSTAQAKLAVFSSPGSVETFTIGECASDAAPKIAVYRDIVTKIAVVYHNSSDEVVISISENMGESWDTQVFNEGRYPNIDIDRLSGECGLCFVGPLGVSIDVATAPSLFEIFSTVAEPVSDMPAFAIGPAVIRHDFYGEEYGLLYMGRTGSGYPKDLWFDSSLFTGIEEGGPVAGQPVSVRPNPSPGTFTVSFQLAQPRQAAVSIYSADGRLVDEIFSGVTSGEDIDVDRELPAGVYTVVLRTESGVSSRRVVSL